MNAIERLGPLAGRVMMAALFIPSGFSKLAGFQGTGWRAAETWFYAYIMGWPSISVYDGGWFEWSQDPENNPIEIGTPGDEVTA